MTLRNVERFTAGCPLCDEAVQLVQDLAYPSCAVQVLDMNDETTHQKAKEYGVVRVPSVAVNGTLADCCRAGAIDVETLRALGIGSPA